ncbi:aspartyl/asparaginyl beta-hydroxylase domain-containing protein [Sphingomonas sp. TDK1]|uniref:aspartyl/asparaginyl beta-hydroxylase domain-containing protein n=1 Tax=Sphingomonas sp. TDK1 TaxID=453247 RepID=UPI0007D9F1CA|nr:aspartyl/asparaginyl beta-hydroxylase domain-containing protein [Sphingomonas sp. TDK1]OAN63892.1 aspartyl beta-hydroxylase [Sphingomonas sp. TDK1]
MRYVYPDRVRLPLVFDPVRLRADLATLAAGTWTPHFVPQNYSGDWGVMPLRAPLGAEHPILQIAAMPDARDFVDRPALQRAPYLREVLSHFDCTLRSVRLMRLGPGSCIREHRDLGLCAEDGLARLHIPILTNSQVRFEVNRDPVVMAPGEVWYLRLSDPHRVDNAGADARVHLVIDAEMSPWLDAQLRGRA